MKTLRAHRLEKLMTAEDLAAKAGVSNKTISDIEVGRDRPRGIQVRTMRKISEALGVPVTEITEFAAVIGGDTK